MELFEQLIDFVQYLALLMEATVLLSRLSQARGLQQRTKYAENNRSRGYEYPACVAAMSARRIKQQVLDLLQQDDLEAVQRDMAALDAQEACNALFSAICRTEERLRWHAVSAMGATVARLADEEMEAARVVVRRLLWSLNEESGGIGWGAPEALAEIICRHDRLAEEYVHMLLSYMRPDGEEAHQDGNFLEHETLQRGLLWAVGRLAQCRREMALAKGMADDLPQYLDSPDAAVRGLAARAMGLLGRCARPERLHELREDCSPLRLYGNGQLRTVTVGELAAQALERLRWERMQFD